MSRVEGLKVRLGVDLGRRASTTVTVAGKEVTKDLVLDEIHVWPAPSGGYVVPFSFDPLASYASTAEASFDAPFAASPSVPPPLVAPDGSDCDHPEDQREPLPYQGGAADPDEWECGACGAWQTKTQTASVLDDYAGLQQYQVDQIAKAFGVPASAVGRLSAGSAAARETFADAVRAAGAQISVEQQIQDALTKAKVVAENQYFSGATMGEVFKKLGAAPKFDAKGSLTIQMDSTMDVADVTSWSDPAGLNAIIPISNRGQKLTITGPAHGALSDENVKDVIYYMDAALSHAPPRLRQRAVWEMHWDVYSRVQRIATSGSSFIVHEKADPRNAQVLGHPMRLDGHYPFDKICLVAE